MQSQNDVEIQLQHLIMEWLVKDTWDETVNRLTPFLTKFTELPWKGQLSINPNFNRSLTYA